MAKKTEKKNSKEAVALKVKSRLTPRVTEKASFSSEKGIYTFNVAERATKNEIKKEIFTLYKVKPVKVNVLAIPKKKVTSRGQNGIRGGGRKAFVYLKKGDKIEFI